LEYQTVEELHTQCLLCQKCILRKGAKQVVPGEGNPHAQIMFIGEGPGKVEDKLGRPFVGPAGKFLDILLESIGLKRQDVFIANTVKCRPPNNRDPFDNEKEACQPWLDEQIRLINPKVFVPLGRHALHKFLPDISISSAHGKLYKSQGRIVFAMYHPAVALYNGSMRQTLLDDIKNLRNFLDGKIEKIDDWEKADFESNSKVIQEIRDIMKAKNAEKQKKEEEGLRNQQMGLF